MDWNAQIFILISACILACHGLPEKPDTTPDPSVFLKDAPPHFMRFFPTQNEEPEMLNFPFWLMPMGKDMKFPNLFQIPDIIPKTDVKLTKNNEMDDLVDATKPGDYKIDWSHIIFNQHPNEDKESRDVFPPYYNVFLSDAYPSWMSLPGFQNGFDSKKKELKSNLKTNEDDKIVSPKDFELHEEKRDINDDIEILKPVKLPASENKVTVETKEVISPLPASDLSPVDKPNTDDPAKTNLDSVIIPQIQVIGNLDESETSDSNVVRIPDNLLSQFLQQVYPMFTSDDRADIVSTPSTPLDNSPLPAVEISPVDNPTKDETAKTNLDTEIAPQLKVISNLDDLIETSDSKVVQIPANILSQFLQQVYPMFTSDDRADLVSTPKPLPDEQKIALSDEPVLTKEKSKLSEISEVGEQPNVDQTLIDKPLNNENIPIPSQNVPSPPKLPEIQGSIPIDPGYNQPILLNNYQGNKPTHNYAMPYYVSNNQNNYPQNTGKPGFVQLQYTNNAPLNYPTNGGPQLLPYPAQANPNYNNNNYGVIYPTMKPGNNMGYIPVQPNPGQNLYTFVPFVNPGNSGITGNAPANTNMYPTIGSAPLYNLVPVKVKTVTNTKDEEES